ncbi:MAG TPA: CRTAC1 family protein [Thermoanaerobaculia bacterium]|nr:CRTAC1 family protein [Thermoanaerobaculia bacterium]
MRAVLRRLALLGSLALASCGGETPAPGADPAPIPPPAGIVLADATAASGVDFVHRNVASPQRLLPETMGSGVAVFDADGDGRPDLLFADGQPLDGAASSGGLELWLNRGGFRFERAPDGSGLDAATYGMGLAVGDVDGDGDLDVYRTGVGRDHLFLNRGDGTFDDGSERWGIDPDHGGFGSSAAFFDADGDGDLDLFAGRYVEWSPSTDQPCSPDGVHRVYCTPEIYPPVANLFYENVGGRFVERTAAAGLDARGKALGVAVLDHGNDGRLDLAVANDTEPNFLFVRRADGGFEETALLLGFALGPSGDVRGGMGIAAGDLDGDGREDLVIGNFANEMAALFRAVEGGLYADEAAASRLGMATLVPLAFGTVMADLDGDRRLDVAFANGHIEPEILEVSGGRESPAQPMQVFRNDGSRFVEAAGVPDRPLVGRGLAAADLDLDGDVDLVATQNGGPAVLLRNDSAPRPWLRIRLRGAGGNSWGQGARVTVELADGERLVRRLEPSGSYLSSSEPVLTVGLGAGSRPVRVVVHWADGGEDVLDDPPLSSLVEVAQSTTPR